MTIVIDLNEIIPNAILNNLRIDIEELEHFYLNSISRLDKDYEDIMRITQGIVIKNERALDATGSEDLERLIRLNDNFTIYKRSKNGRSHLLIIGSFMLIEKAIKELIGGIKGIKQEKVRQLHRFDALKEILNEKFNIGLEEVEDFDSYNELRILNNCIKHSSVVDAELAGINNDIWRENDEIENVYDQFKRLKEPALNFCRMLFEKITMELSSRDIKKS